MPGQKQPPKQPIDVMKNLATDMAGNAAGKFESSYKRMMERFAQAGYDVVKLERGMAQLKSTVLKEIPKGTLTQYAVDMKVILDRMPKAFHSQYDQTCRSLFPEIDERELEWDQLEKNINDQIKTMQNYKKTKTSIPDLKKAYANLSELTTKYIRNVNYLLDKLDTTRTQMLKRLAPQDKQGIKASIGEISKPEL